MKKIAHSVIRPLNSLNLLSKQEIEALSSTRKSVYAKFRDCALAILNTDSNIDDAAQILVDYSDFDIKLIPQSRGLKLEIYNAPAQSYVDGRMIRGIREHLFSALRDIVYYDFKLGASSEDTAGCSSDITTRVFRSLRNARVVRPDLPPRLVVCWGGHSIPREEYDYAKHVGYELGLRGLDIATGCGIGAMKGPMKGAAVGHAKQQIKTGRYIGISEPGIIASESPNAIVNELVIMPDIEKRLEAFVRLAHGMIVFPGGVGTVEEILYLLSILCHPNNRQGIPILFVGPESCRAYFKRLDRFLKRCLGDEVANHYQIIIGAPALVGQTMKLALKAVHAQRRNFQEAYYFNWDIYIDPMLQEPFIPTHENMASLRLDPTLPRQELASQLRQAFSGLVAGNVKAYGINEIAKHGPYQLSGDPKILVAIDELLCSFVKEKRMKLVAEENDYQPCYELNG